MVDIIVPVHELKAKLSEYIARAVHGNERILVSRRDKPVALLIGMEVAEEKPPYQPKGLDSVDWEEFYELGEALQSVYEGRQEEGYSEVSL